MVKVRWKILFQICALITSDCNGKMLKSIDKNKKILQKYKSTVFGTHHLTNND